MSVEASTRKRQEHTNIDSLPPTFGSCFRVNYLLLLAASIITKLLVTLSHAHHQLRFSKSLIQYELFMSLAPRIACYTSYNYSI